MIKHGDIIRPKFELVLETLERELEGLGIGEWTKPHGGYFISFDSMEGCAKSIVEKAKEAGVVMELVLETLERELEGLGIGEWTKPHGGYFISFDSMEGCAKSIVEKAKEAGVVMTGAGATYPYGKDPKDSNIRIAPTFPSLEELKKAAEVFVLCVKLASEEKLLAQA